LIPGIQLKDNVSFLVMQILCDKDPSVMSAVVCALFDPVTADAQGYKNFTTSFMSILKQVAEHQLPKLYDYHQTPAPFNQVTLLFPSFNKSWIFL
jgi:AP-4 complex subunit epsilon-1